MTAISMDRRHGVRVRTDCRLVSHRDGLSVDGRAFDLSAGGALIRSAVGRPPPMLQRLQLDVGTDDPVATFARTVWIRDEWCAVRFVGMSDVDRLEIAEHLDRVQRRRRDAAALAAAHFKRPHREMEDDIPPDRQTLRGIDVPPDRSTLRGTGPFSGRVFRH